jgi:hypothetical protein
MVLQLAPLLPHHQMGVVVADQPLALTSARPGTRSPDGQKSWAVKPNPIASFDAESGQNSDLPKFDLPQLAKQFSVQEISFGFKQER